MIQDTPNSEGQTLKAHNKVESYESRRKKKKQDLAMANQPPWEE